MNTLDTSTYNIIFSQEFTCILGSRRNGIYVKNFYAQNALGTADEKKRKIYFKKLFPP